MHILFIALDAPYAAAQRQVIVNAGHIVTSSQAGEACEAAAAYAFDAIILASAGADPAAARLVHALKASQRRTPLLVVVEKPGAGEVAQLLGQGADDVVLRARGGGVMLAHVVALVRSAHGHARARIVIDEALEVDLAALQCRLAGQTIHLTPMEYRLIEALALRRDMPVPRHRLLELIYGADNEAVAKSIDRTLYNIRNKFSGLTQRRYLHTRAKAVMLSGEQSHTAAAAAAA